MCVVAVHVVIIRWNLNTQTVELHERNVPIPEAPEVGVDRELFHFDQWRRVGLLFGSESQSGADRSQTGVKAHGERAQIGIDIEPLLQSVDQPYTDCFGRKRD